MNIKDIQHLPFFWSYDISNEMPADAVVIEQILKFGDTDLVIKLFNDYKINTIIEVWQHTMQNDVRFKRQNYFLKHFFLPNIKSLNEPETRLERLKKFASKH